MRSKIGSVPGQRETPSSIAGELLDLELAGLPLDHAEKTLAAVTKTTSSACVPTDPVEPRITILRIVIPV